MFKRFKSLSHPISTGIMAVALLGTGAYAAKSYFGGDCCAAGASCCKPGVACCKGGGVRRRVSSGDV